MVNPATLQAGASLRLFMDEWMQLLAETMEARHPELRLYRWRPLGAIELPAVYNWLVPSPHEDYTTAHARDPITIDCRVAVPYNTEEADAIEVYADSFRELIDPALWTPSPLNGAGGQRVQRQSMGTVADSFNEVPVLAMTFPITARLTHQIK